MRFKLAEKVETMMRKLFLLLMVLAVWSAPVVASSYKDDCDSWKDQILYFVLIDRFFNADKSNDHEVDVADLEGFHGGDIAGVTEKLDYLDRLGVTGIWLSPFFKNRFERFFKQQPYHGYWPHDFWAVDERFGNMQQLLELRQQLASREKKLLLDMVVNHVGYDAAFVEANPDWFNPAGEIKNWSDNAELYHKSIYGLPDFASHKSVVKTFFRLVARHWVEKIRPDGFRLDAVKHVPPEFWRDFNANAMRLGGKKFLLLGEFLNGDPAEVRKTWVEGGFNSLFDFPLYYTMKSVFAEGGDCRQLAARLYHDGKYPDAGLLATFLDNHDLDRFITSCGGDQRRYMLAMAFLMTVRGIPVLCYGNEVGLEGAHGKLPENRRSMVFDEENEMFDFTRNLIALRRSSEALRRGLHCHLFADETAFVFGRLTPDFLAVVAFNNSDAPRRIECDFPFETAGDKRIIAAWNSDNRAILRQGRFETFLPARSFAVYLPESTPGFYEKTFRHWQKRYHHEKAWGTKKVVLKLKIDYLPEKAKVFVTGSADELGSWNSDRSVPMLPVADDEYEVEVKLPLGKIFECKCFYRLDGNTVWMEGDNVIAEVRPTGSEYVHLTWKTME